MEGPGCLILLLLGLTYWGAGTVLQWHVTARLRRGLTPGTARTWAHAWLRRNGWTVPPPDASAGPDLEAHRLVSVFFPYRVVARLRFDGQDRLLQVEADTMPPALSDPAVQANLAAVLTPPGPAPSTASAPVVNTALLLPQKPGEPAVPTLGEDLLLLALDEQVPRHPDRLLWNQSSALIAALLGDLSLRGRIRVSAATIRVIDRSATGDDLLDEVLAILASTELLWAPVEWLQIITLRLPALPQRVVQRLVDTQRARRAPQGLLAAAPATLPAALQQIQDRKLAGKPVSQVEAARLTEHLQRPWRIVLVERIRAVLLLKDRCDDRLRYLILLADAVVVPEAVTVLGRLFQRQELKVMQPARDALDRTEPLPTLIRLAGHSGRVYQEPHFDDVML